MDTLVCLFVCHGVSVSLPATKDIILHYIAIVCSVGLSEGSECIPLVLLRRGSLAPGSRTEQQHNIAFDKGSLCLRLHCDSQLPAAFPETGPPFFSIVLPTCSTISPRCPRTKDLLPIAYCLKQTYSNTQCHIQWELKCK